MPTECIDLGLGEADDAPSHCPVCGATNVEMLDEHSLLCWTCLLVFGNHQEE